jgi:hypothetical protein
MPAGKRRCTPGTVFFNQVNCLNYSFSGSLFFETQENNISISGLFCVEMRTSLHVLESTKGMLKNVLV